MTTLRAVEEGTMTTLRAPHEAHDHDKLTDMIDRLRSGSPLPPVVAIGDSAISGSHRIAAYARLGMDIPVIDVPLNVAWAAADSLYLDSVEELLEYADYEAVCRAIYDATDDPTLRAALEDQI